MSIAVLRTFIKIRQHEHETMLSKRNKGARKSPDKVVENQEAPSDTNAITQDGKSNGECKESEKTMEL